ncbi:MAG: GNAT family N-acetyltransferase [Fimbriimonadaceae bacterium]
MNEVRTIRKDEAEEFLGLLCGVFRLDVSRARTVFFSEPLFDLARKWALYVDGTMASILTTSPLLFGWGKAIGIAGVATAPPHLGRGLATELLTRVLEQAEGDGEGPAMLFAHAEGLYRRLGFEAVDEVVRGELLCDGTAQSSQSLSTTEVRELYGHWSERSLARLVRDDTAQTRWSWNLRHCERLLGGYACIEPGQVREAWLPEASEKWPFAHGTEWVGMTAVARDDRVPLHRARRELIVMTRNFPLPPQMFMTDQF